MQFNRCFRCMKETGSNPCPHCGFDVNTYKAETYELPLGSILANRYVIGKRLGQGGFGITYVGWDLALAAKVAIKEFFPSGQVTRHPTTGTKLLWNDGEQARRYRAESMDTFVKEARKMVKVNDLLPVVRVLNTFQENESAYIIMEFVEGENLKASTDKTGPLSWAKVTELFYPIIETMRDMHEAGIIHRDISPDNLMLQPDGTLRILDLGAAKDISVSNGKSSMLVAKEGYSPIEQYTQSGKTASYTDVYALAATMYYILTGVVPPPAVDRFENDTLNWELPALADLQPHEKAAMQSALTVLSGQRTQTMGDFFRSLTEPDFEIPKAGQEAKPAPVKKAKKKKKSNAGWIALAASLVLVLGGAAAYFGGLIPGKTQEPAPTQMQAEVVEETVPATTAAPAPENPTPAVTGPVTLKAEGLDAILNGTPRAQVSSIRFVNGQCGVPEPVDVSEAGNAGILGWLEKEGDGNALCISTAGDLKLPQNSSRLFEGFLNAKSIDFSIPVNTASVTDMSGMFADCVSLESLDLTGFQGESLNDTSEMFLNCSNLKSITLDGFNTAQVRSMSRMFSGCTALEDVDLTGFNTAKVTDMSGMFSGCANADRLDIWNFNVLNVSAHDNFMDASKTSMGQKWDDLFLQQKMMISDTSGTTVLGSTNFKRSEIRKVRFLTAPIENVDRKLVKEWDVSAKHDGSIMARVETYWTAKELTVYSAKPILAPMDCSELFANYTIADEFDFSNLDTSQVRSMHGMFRECNSLKDIDLNSLNTSRVTDMSEMFNYCDALTNVKINELDTSSVRNMSKMFMDVRSQTLGILDLNGWDTSSVTDMSSMFNNCIYIRELDVSSFNTKNVTTMEKMFMNCQAKLKFDVSNFDTSSCTNMRCMFFNCSRMAELDLGSFDTRNVTDMSDMFSGCTTLAKLNLSSFDTSSCRDMRGMFNECIALLNPDLSGFHTSKVTDMSKMFYNCSGIYNPDLSHFDVSNVTDYTDFMKEGRPVNGRPWQELFR